MKLLKNRIFAIILTAVVIVGCCAYGFLTRPNETAADQTHLEYGKTNYSSYLDWIADEAGLLSDETEQLVASYMGALDHGWGSIVAVVTEDSGGADLQTRAEDWAAKGDLSGWDMILLLDAASGRWYMQPGADISPYVDQTLTTTVTACFDSRSVTEDADEILTELFPDLYTWYEDTVTAQDGGNNGMLALLILVIVLLVVFGGFIYGLAIAIALRGGASTAGTDFISLMVSNKTGKSIWGLIFAGNCVVLVIFGALFGWTAAAFSIIFQFISTKTIETFYHRYDRMTMVITTKKPDEVLEAYHDAFKHGSSCYEAIGGYSRKTYWRIETVVSSYEVGDIVALVRAHDDHAVINVFRSEGFFGRFYRGPVD